MTLTDVLGFKGSRLRYAKSLTTARQAGLRVTSCVLSPTSNLTPIILALNPDTRNRNLDGD